MISIVYLLFSSLSSPSNCVSPSDPTLTVENVTEVMGVVESWKKVAKGSLNTSGLRIPDFKIQEIKQQSSTKKDRSHSLGRYWVYTDPDASWVKLAHVLYEEEEEKALVMVKKYLPKGMFVS